MKAGICELCKGEASVYCASDSAFLCWNCDSVVHQANFLVARHIRLTLYSNCKGFSGNQISGAGVGNLKPFCRSCLTENYSPEIYSVSSCSSSACVSSTESCSTDPNKSRLDDHRKKTEKIVSSSSITELAGQKLKTPVIFDGQVTSEKKRKEERQLKSTSHADNKAAEILMNWSRGLGLNGHLISPLALRALNFCLGKLTVFSFRVVLAVSFWFGLRFCKDVSKSTNRNLKRLEEVSGVPAKVFLAAEAKLVRELRLWRPRCEMEEGWAESECSV
ncbi:B-box zinc finger protein [Quillaja saponaria]|uniref:B-box zinc finger protein n=1 Tax=Quillaja saponaria TaxID=32244 RepID=A0AAD7LTB2_QUISA|nr:B-box zinc finger protein [Quillaja saponaria]